MTSTLEESLLTIASCAHTKDELLTNIMIYLVTGSFNSASWIYYGRREEGGRVLSPEGKRVEVHKFGGTSVGSAARIQACAVLVAEQIRLQTDMIVVSSAMSGVTDKLVAAANHATAGCTRGL